MLLRVSRSSQRARRSSASAPAAPSIGLWIPDTLVRQSFDRFVTAVLARSSRPGVYEHVRHGSSLPGPLECRRRLLKRRHNDQAHSPQQSFTAQQLQSVFPINPYLWPDVKPPRTIWLPPDTDFANNSNSVPLSWWQTPPRPPSIELLDSQSTASTNIHASRLTAITITEYANLLSSCGSLRDVKRLHKDISNAILDAPMCSSLAFQHLLSINAALSSKNLENTVPFTHLVDFLRDPILEHTRGSNLVRLASHISNNDSSAADSRARLVPLVQDGLRAGLFSAHALAGLKSWVATLQPIEAIFSSQETDLQELAIDISTRFWLQLSSPREALPPSFADLTSLISIAAESPDATNDATLMNFILDRTHCSFESGNLTIDQCASLLQRLPPIIHKSEGIPQPESIVPRLRQFWPNGPAITPSTLDLIISLITVTNALSVTRITTTFAVELVRYYASHANVAPSAQQSLILEHLLTNVARNLLFYDKLRPHPAVNSSLTRRQSCSKNSQYYNSDDVSVSNSSSTYRPASLPRMPPMSSLTLILDKLPPKFVEMWIVRTSNSFIDLIHGDRSEEKIQLLNSWLVAVSRSKAIGLRVDSTVWGMVFDRLNEIIDFLDLTTFFQTLRTDMVCRVYMRLSIAKDLKLKQGTGAVSRVCASSLALTSPRRRPLIRYAFARYEHGKPLPETSVLSHEFRKVPSHSESKSTQQTIESLESAYDQAKTMLSFQGRYARSSARCYLCVLRALVKLGLPIDKVFLELLQLAEAMHRSIPFEALIEAWSYAHRVPKVRFVHKLLNKHLGSEYKSTPGWILRLFRQKPQFRLWQHKQLVTLIISSPRSRVHPELILRLLKPSNPKPASLSPIHVNAIQHAAMQFAKADRLPDTVAWQSVKQCLYFLDHHHALMDSRMSQSLVTAGLRRPLENPLTKAPFEDAFELCSRVLTKVEGQEEAEHILGSIYDLQKRISN